MTNEEIFELAEQHGDWDDFGRWTFQDNDRLLAFVVAVLKTKRQWVGLTEKEILEMTSHHSLIRHFENRLKEKNHD